MNRVFDRVCGVRVLASLAGLAAAMVLSAAGAYAAPLGSVTEFSAGLNAGAHPYRVALGSEGNMWFTDIGTTKAIGKITPSGTITEFSTGLNSGAVPTGVALGSEGNMWFTDTGTTKAIGEDNAERDNHRVR